jgi:hypothetical protein
MGLFITAERALWRLIENEDAGIMQRVRALQQAKRPPLILLRRLIVDSKTPRTKPVPAKLKALATLRYAQEFELRRLRRLKKVQQNKPSDNALGII